MERLSRYIAKTILQSMGMVALVMCGLYIIFTFVAESSSLGQGSYGVLQALTFVLLSLPVNIYLVLPVVALLGGLLGLGNLSNHGEILSMRAAGVSLLQLSRGVIYAAIILALISFIVGSYLGPLLMQYATVKKAVEQQGQAVLMTQNSTWLKQNNDFIFIGKAQSNGVLQDIRRYKIENYHLVELDTVGEAVYQNHEWQLKNITVINFGPTKIEKKVYPRGVWESLVTPPLLNILVSKSGNLTLLGLKSYIDYRKNNGLDTASYWLTFWQMFFEPLSVIVLGLMALPFVLGSVRSGNSGGRWILGVGVGFLFFIINQLFSPMTIVYHLPPLLIASLPTLVFSIILVGLLFWRNFKLS